MVKIIVGIDEVGRGPLAGPVTVGAVAFFVKHQKNINIFLRGIKDSKKLSPKQRDEWCKKIKSEQKLYPVVASVGPSVIDRLGISRAAKLAVRHCLYHLEAKLPNCGLTSKWIILLDGNLAAPRTYLNQKTIIKGDEKVPIISAASIIAKVHRDNIMRKYHHIFPKYRFDLHKGYGTRLHSDQISQYGLCDIHRKTFYKKF